MQRVVPAANHRSILASRSGQKAWLERNHVRQQELPLAALQARHAGTRLDRNVLPPLLRGRT
jgi:hypothetical protein